MVRITFLIIILCSCFISRAGAEESTGPVQIPALFKNIKTFPANGQDLAPPHFIVNHDGDGEGEEMPSSIMYSGKNKKEYWTSMTITDLSLCKRRSEKEICRDFVKMISAAPPALGADITGTRIGGSGYGTVFLSRIDSVKLDGVDAFTAFIAADSQDPPLSEVILYIYAKKGTNLIQLNTRVEDCAVIPETPLDDVSYYKRFCVNEKIIAKARSKAKELTEKFRLKTYDSERPDPAPERVVFQKGKSGADLKGRIYGYECKDYVIGAKEKQLMTLRISSKNMYATFRIVSINGRPDGKLMPGEGSEFSGRLPETGDYSVRVCMMRTGARKKGAMADYTLKVSIK